MKKINKVSIIILSLALILLGVTGPTATFAATAPNLGAAIGYSVFGNAGITETAAQTSHLWGNAGGNGLGHASLIAAQVDGAIDAGANVPVVGAISSAYGDLAGEAQTGAIDLAASPTVVPGVYDVAATAFNSTLTLNGAGVYIFRSTGSIAQTAGGTMLLTNGACASNVFWQIPTSMTFAAAGNIEGTIITNTGLISFVSGVSLKGRAWAATQVTMDNNQITEPTCAPAPQLIVNKVVINDNGGTKVVSDFPLFIDGGSVTSGVASTTTVGLHTVSETSDPGYTSAISGNCAADGTITLALGDVKICTITNDDIAPASASSPIYPAPVPPLIDVVKVPSPLVLPLGSGLVTYTYTLHNIGTVSVSSVTMVDDSCSSVTRISGDINSNSNLDLNEVWIYSCSTTLTKTHTNTVVATAWANGISATDIANATVIVGVPVVPPLIHVTKVPNPLVLSAGGGMVTYTNKVTNPGTVALSNVHLTDDKCGPVKYISGDTNGDSKLDTIETWTYTCQTKLTKTTVNTITASGEANGLIARDFAITTVVVSAAPKLPNTGLPSDDNGSAPWNIIIPAGIFIALFSLYLARRKQTT